MSSEMSPYVVVAACIVSEGRVLLVRRTHGSNPETIGKFELPGGRANIGESLQEALAREIREELNLGLRIGDLLHAQVNTYSDGEDYLVLYYHCRLHSSSVLKEEGIWVNASSIEGLDTLPGTEEAISEVARRGYLL